MEPQDEKRMRQQERLFSEYEHYQRQLQDVLLQKFQLEREIVRLKAKIIEADGKE